MGKTRILEEARRLGQAMNVKSARIACLSLTTPLPFDPILALLRALGEAAIFVPDARSPHDLFGVHVDRLERHATGGPLLFCLDDLQWWDAGTLEPLQYCLVRMVDLSLGWMFAARTGEGQTVPIHRLARTGPVERIDLAPLSAPETRSLAGAILGARRVSDELAAVLFKRTGGNPLL